MPETVLVPRQTCIHFWVIEPPHGPTSHGVCTLCGIERDFQNWIPQVVSGYDWEQNRMTDIWLPGSRRLE